ncbi:MAG: DUF4384 domain-containing protein [Leptolyngbya sp. SIOISBB]|nr:DUF4384 domain-containing protein [Leptolyngbya sp. SIOISBB]
MVVFHFSGHGARVQEYQFMREFLQDLGRGCINPDSSCLNTTIVPYDAGDPGGPVVQDVMGHTLLLMRSALPTDNVTFVLDCCYSGGGKRGNVVMRSRDATLINGSAQLPQLTDKEWPYQQQLLERLGWGPQDFVNQINSKEGKGFFVAASRANQQSADYPFDGFSAGAFTYLLTQYLWHETNPLSVTIPIVAGSTSRLSEHSQVPEYDPTEIARVREAPIYHEDPSRKSAEAAVKGLTADGQLQLWLGGLEPTSLEAFNRGAVFTVIHRENGTLLGQVTLVDGSRDGLNALGQWLPATAGDTLEIAIGHLLREKLRGLPDVITLRVGLDDTLSTSEQDQAKSALARQSSIEVVEVGSGQDVHVLIGRYDSNVQARMNQSEVPPEYTPPLNSIGFFSATQEPWYRNSFGGPGESIEQAITRLAPRLSSLLIRRMLALMANPYSQQLGVGLIIEHQGAESGIRNRRGETVTFIPVQEERGIERVPACNLINVIVDNSGDDDLYVGLVVIDAAGLVNVVFPFTTDDARNNLVFKGERRQIQTLRGDVPYGLPELLLLASPQPLDSTLTKLRQVVNTLAIDDGTLEESLCSSTNTQRGTLMARLKQTSDAPSAVDVVMTDMFGALDGSRGNAASGDLPAGPRAVGVDQIAVISRLFHVVPAE